MSSASYKITRPLKELPPSRPFVQIITQDTEIDFARKFQVIAIDQVIRNKDVVGASVTLNEQKAFTIDAGDTFEEDNVSIYYVRISNVTNAVLVCHVMDISTLVKYGAIELA